MTYPDNNDNNGRKHLALGFIFWFAILAIFLMLASCRAKKTTVETSKIETTEIVHDSVLEIEKSEITIEKTTPVATESFYPYDTTRTDNPIFENEIDNGSTKVRISSTKKGLRITTLSKPVENKASINIKEIKQTHTQNNTNIVEKSWYQRIIALPIFLRWWFWLLVILISLIIWFYVKKFIWPKKIIDTITDNEN